MLVRLYAVAAAAAAAGVWMTCIAGARSSNTLFNKVLSTDPDLLTVLWREIE